MPTPWTVAQVLAMPASGNAYTRRLDAQVAAAEAARLNWRWIESQLLAPLDKSDATCRNPET
jgi:hypothetical protein